MKDLTSTSFGYLIGFLLPGVLGLYALSSWLPQAGALMQPIMKADTTVGPSVVFLFIAVGMGVIISAVRYFVLEKRYKKKKCISDDVFKRMTAERLALIRAFAEEHYRYHQFYGGCFIAILILFVGWFRQQWPLKGNFTWHVVFVTVAFVVLERLLERSACDSYEQYVRRCNSLPPEETGKEAAK